ncbi:MAG: alpha/beta fold hydrolase [Streptosporangiales bacterium]|nr:alpha/beta fold hydrolase [Streptosporangiales bacterium]
MPIAHADGIPTRYEVIGSGPPLLLFSPGGFDSVQENWRELGIYRRLRLLDHLSESYTCITFDRREAGESGGRLERLSWDGYAAQGAGLLDHLGFERAHLMGGCAGCSTVAAFAVARPERALSMVLFSPAGGVKYRMKQHDRFARHLAYVDEHGLDGAVALAQGSDQGFSKDPRVGPWAPVLRNDAAFAEAYAGTDAGRYRILVDGIARLLYDRDTVPGAEPEDLLRLDIPALIVPGEDDSHAPSAARYLQECLPQAEYWDVPVAGQTESTAPAEVLRFLDKA